MTIGLIFAAGNNSAFGLKGKLPWKIAEDMAFFQRITKGHAVIMGRKTWDSLPAKSRPLPDRINIVISRSKKQSSYEDGVYFVQDIQTAIFTAQALRSQKIWVIGGPSIIKAAEPWAEIAVITEVMYKGKYDVAAPCLNGKSWQLQDVRFPSRIRKGCPAFNFQFWRPTRVLQGGATYE